MTLLFLIVLATSFLIILFMYKNTKKSKIEKVAFFLVILLVPTLIYLYKTNYWIGENIVEKFNNNLNIEIANKISPQAIYKIIISLESRLRDNPADMETIKKLAKAKYLFSDFKGALKTYELGRAINGYDLELLLGEANIRLFMEKDTVSKKTVSLFKKIIEQESNNLMGLLVLGDYSYKTNNMLQAKKYYEKLLGLLDKNSLEYKEIYKKFKKTEIINEK